VQNVSLDVASGLEGFVREVHLVHLADDLFRSVTPIGAVRLIALETIDVKLGDVQIGEPVDDPVRHQAANSATLQDAE